MQERPPLFCGITPKDPWRSTKTIRDEIRLVLSLQLLNKNLSILEISMDLGYKSDSSYIYTFKRVFIISPINIVKIISLELSYNICLSKQKLLFIM